jgi:hypothetical protein
MLICVYLQSNHTGKKSMFSNNEIVLSKKDVKFLFLTINETVLAKEKGY